MSKISNRVPITTRGDLVRGGAGGALERLAAVTDNRVVAGDGTDVVLKQIDDPAFFATGAEGTASAHGVFLKNLYQRENLGGNVAVNDTDFLEFTGLTVGKIYKFSGTVGFSLGSADVFFRCFIREGTTNVSAITANPGATTNAKIYSISFTHLFTATETSIKLRTGSLGGSEVVIQTDSVQATWATLEELNNYAVTTAW